MINEFNHLATDMILKALAHELAESKNGIRKNALHTAIQIVKLYQKKELENIMDANFIGYTTGVYAPQDFDIQKIITYYESSQEKDSAFD